MPWWDHADVAVGMERSLALGRLELRVARSDGSIRVAQRANTSPESADVTRGEPVPMEALDDSWKIERHVARAGPITWMPRLAPRPVVARPEVPFTVAPGAAVKVYVSTPVWVALLAGGQDLAEFPVVAGKLTWFGTSTEGEQCFAMRTVMRMALAEVVTRPHRAVVPVSLRNQGEDALKVERVWIPVPTLTLHLDDNQRLWTREVLLVRREGQETAECRLGKAGPGPALFKPRAEPDGNVVMRVFNSVFG